MQYEPSAGDSIDTASRAATEIAFKIGRPVTFNFNRVECICKPDYSVEENQVACRAALGLPAIDPPIHPQTAADALARWDKGEIVTTVEMGGIGPGYEQAIQVLVFEIIRDAKDKPLPTPSEVGQFGDWCNDTISRIDETCGRFSGAQVGAARYLAYRALRDGWEKMLNSVPEERRILVSRDFPQAPLPTGTKPKG